MKLLSGTQIGQLACHIQDTVMHHPEIHDEEEFGGQPVTAYNRDDERGGTDLHAPWELYLQSLVDADPSLPDYEDMENDTQSEGILNDLLRHFTALGR